MEGTDKVWAIYQCILQNDWRKVTYSLKYMVSIAQSSFVQKFQVDFCNKICRAHTVLAKFKI